MGRERGRGKEGRGRDEGNRPSWQTVEEEEKEEEQELDEDEDDFPHPRFLVFSLTGAYLREVRCDIQTVISSLLYIHGRLYAAVPNNGSIYVLTPAGDTLQIFSSATFQVGYSLCLIADRLVVAGAEEQCNQLMLLEGV